MRLVVGLVLLTVASPVAAQTMGSTSGANSSVDISSPANTTSTSHLITAPTVAAPGLAAAGIETCLGSAAGGLSLMGGGFTFGSTKVDEGCTIRLLARQLFAFGLQKAAVALMCQDDRVALAMATAGSPCPGHRVEASEPAAASDQPLALFDGPVAAASVPSTAANVPAAPPVPASAPPAQAGERGPESTGSFHISFMPRPFSLEEQAWFERASNIN